MAEVLITLGIIGIVAAVTLPILISNYRKHVVETRLKAAYSQLFQAISLSEIQNGELTSWEVITSSYNQQNEWINKYIAPYLEHTKVGRNQDPQYIKQDNGKVPYIKLKNGTIIYFHMGSYADFFIDINGLQKPNKLGYDQFICNINIRNLNNTRKGLFMYGYIHITNHKTAVDICTRNSGMCGALIQYDGWKIKNDYPYKF